MEGSSLQPGSTSKHVFGSHRLPANFVSSEVAIFRVRIGAGRVFDEVPYGSRAWKARRIVSTGDSNAAFDAQAASFQPEKCDFSLRISSFSGEFLPE